MKLSTNNKNKLFSNKITKEKLINTLRGLSDESLAKFGLTREKIEEAISKGIYRGKYIAVAIATIFNTTFTDIEANAFEDFFVTQEQSYSQQGEYDSQNEINAMLSVSTDHVPEPLLKAIAEEIEKDVDEVTYADLQGIDGLVIELESIDNVDFIKYFPNVNSMVICSKTINDISALSYSNIESLTIYLSPISSSDLSNIPSTLTSLSIDNCMYIDDLDILAESCPNLESLDISCCPSVKNLDVVKALSKLKELKVNQIGCITQNLVEYLNSYGIQHDITSEKLSEAAEIDSIISQIITEDMNDQEKISAIVAYVMRNIDYRISKVEDSNIYPLTTALDGEGVCASYAYLTSVLLTKAGIESYEVVDKDHGWNIVRKDGKYYFVDSTNISQIPFAATIVENLDFGIYYMQDPFSTGLSAMSDADDKETVMSDELLEKIIESEKDKSFIEKNLSNNIYNALAAAGILIALRAMSKVLSNSRGSRRRRRR